MVDARMNFVAAGAVQHGEDVRLWAVDEARGLRWRSSVGVEGAALPVPGIQRVLACDPWSDPLIVLADGEAWVYRKRPGAPARWRSKGNLLREVVEMFKQKAEQRGGMAEAPLQRAWVERAAAPRRGRCIVAVSSERQILVLDEDGHGRIAGPGPVPGASEILAAVVDGEGSTVLTADGVVWLTPPRGRGWVQIGSMMAGAAPGVALRCLKGFKLDVDRTLAAGDSFTVDSLERARELMRLGFAAPAPPEPDAA